MDAPDRVLVDSVAEPEGEAPIDGALMAAALRANAWRIAAAVAAVTLVVLVVSLAAADRYRATARIVPTASAPTAGATTGDADTRGLSTSLAFLTTAPVRAAAAKRVPGESAASLQDKVSAAVESGADVIDVTATDGDPGRAAVIANAVATAFLDQRAAAARASLNRTAAGLRAQLAADPPAEQAAAIRTRLGELAVQRADAGGDLELAETAQPPSSPSSPRPLRNAVIAFFAALLIAVVAVLAHERLRPHAGGARELARLAGVPVLATLPDGSGPRFDGLAHRLAQLGRRLPSALRPPVRRLVAALVGRDREREARRRIAMEEALHALLAAVMLDLPVDRHQTLLVTSPRSGQGTACVTAELARALAEAGQRSLALSVDLTSPALGRELGVAPEPGLAQALAHAAAGNATTLRPSAARDAPEVAVVPSGGPEADGLGLLRPGAVDALFAAIDASAYGFVLVEAPGLLSAPETRLVGRHADAVVLVCDVRAPGSDVADTRQALARLAVPVLGVIATAGAPRARAADQDAVGSVPAVEAAPALALAGPATNGRRPDGEVARAEPDPELVARLRDADHPLTTAELRGALENISATRLRAQLRELMERGEVERSGSGLRGDPYVYGVRKR